MKNIFKSSLLLLSSICLFAACADDNDSNPTLVMPTTFYQRPGLHLVTTQLRRFPCSCTVSDAVLAQQQLYDLCG